ncbi:hypothetical protein [Bacillus sp. SM2101]|uniref:hypothetical protein n=1 Tax=Bacillus sp. SM2101 TaxID=2805366 RepID=UPI001BDECC06|nr:hypothetical protein [Bacillus sp. SM2101]
MDSKVPSLDSNHGFSTAKYLVWIVIMVVPIVMYLVWIVIMVVSIVKHLVWTVIMVVPIV